MANTDSSPRQRCSERNGDSSNDTDVFLAAQTVQERVRQRSESGFVLRRISSEFIGDKRDATKGITAYPHDRW